MSRHFLTLLAGVALTPAFSIYAADTALIDGYGYANAKAASAVWQPMKGSPDAAPETRAGKRVLRLECPFSTGEMERASWDRVGKVDLATVQGVEFEVMADDVAPVSHFSIYFHSGAGWYSTTFYPETAGKWSKIVVDKAKTTMEGSPAGWEKVDTIRVSAWRGRSRPTTFYIGPLRTFGALGAESLVAVLRSEANATGRGKDEFAEGVVAAFGQVGMPAVTLSDRDVSLDQLRKAKLVVLPNNSTLPEAAATNLLAYLEGGGKLMAFYNLPSQLRKVIGIQMGAHVKAETPGRFSSIHFAAPLNGGPAEVGQRSWNINDAKPIDGKSKMLAEWYDGEGKATGHAAVIASSNCILMTHVLLKDDAANKRRMLMAMAGYIQPELWKRAAETAILRVGEVGPAETLDQALRLLPAASGAKVRAAVTQARALFSEGRFTAAHEQAGAAHTLLLHEYAKSKKPLPGEFRAFWCHSALGVEGMEWDEAIKRLADAGFNAILPNMLWGGAAYYDSKTLPVVAPERGDQIAKCVAAGKKYGVQVHVWKVNWNLGHAVPAEHVAKMRAAARLQRSYAGKEEPWLCPSHPENQALEIASMVEVARNYDVDGIHFDYIRYPDIQHCYCEGCRARFAAAIQKTVERWPEDVGPNGRYRAEWLEWRRSNITKVVKAVSEQARAAKPKIKISAAVFRNWEVDRDGVGQDWKVWCDKGYLDFVCPMDYTNSDGQFDNYIRMQKEWAGKVPVYPGIGESASNSRLAPDHVIGQIEVTRRHNTNGFVIFNYAVPEAVELLPVLGLGITRNR